MIQQALETFFTDIHVDILLQICWLHIHDAIQPHPRGALDLVTVEAIWV